MWPRRLLLLTSLAAACGTTSSSPDAGPGGADAAPAARDAASSALDARIAADAQPEPDAAVTEDAALAPDGGAAEDAAASEDAATAPEDAGTIRCTPSMAECVADVARVCAADGDGYHELTCENGCSGGVCAPLSLETGWHVHQFALTNDSVTTPASYVFQNNGLVAVQTANPMASVYLNDAPLPESVVITGRFSVRTTADDDLVGFVFGWQDPEHFYLVDWKQSRQDDGTCGLSEEGASLKVASSSVALDDCTDFWRSTGTGRVRPLVSVATNPDGWEDNADYDLRLVYRPGDISIQITRGGTVAVSITSTDATYRSGKFGFFNYSQESVRYELFSISPTD